MLALVLLAACSRDAEVAMPAVAAACQGCHGPYGISAHPAIPDLAGIPEENFVASMRAYQDSDGGGVMARIAPGYSKAEIAAMAHWFAELGAP